MASPPVIIPRLRDLSIVVVLLSLVVFISRFNITWQDERDTVPDITSEKAARLQLMDALAPPSPEHCSDVTLTNAMNRIANSKLSMIDHINGPVAMRCGRFHWELNGTEFSVEGPNLCHAVAGEEGRITIRTSEHSCINKYIFQVRLEGPALVSAYPGPLPNVTVSTSREGGGPDTGCEHTQDYFYVVHTPGVYTMEVKVAWLNPDNDGLMPPATYLGAQRRYSYEFDWYCMLAAHLPGSPFRVLVEPSAHALSGHSHLPSCGAEHRDLVSQGQWLRYESIGNACSGPLGVYCNNASSEALSAPYLHPRVEELLFDKWLFNHKWIWMPSTCYYPMWSQEDVLSKLQRRGVKRIIFSGDSLMREIYHMVVQLLSDEFEVGVPCAELPGEHQLLTRNGLLLEFFSQKESDYKLTTFEAAYGRPCDETDRHTVVVDNFRVAHFAWKSPEEDFERELDNLLSMADDHCWSVPKIKVFMGNNTVHAMRESGVTPRVSRFTSMAYERLRELNYTLVDTSAVTAARSDAAWDGLHYVLTGDPAVDDPCGGGVGFMMAQILLNKLFTNLHEA